jgi:very-short-patch-repair endonuclease
MGNMLRTDNLVLLKQAKDLSRRLRKSQTKAEKIIWENVRKKRLKGLKFYRQIPIYYEINSYESCFIADFFCFEKKTIVEIDGKFHHYRKKEDNIRTEILNSLGIRVLRFCNEDVENDLNQVLITIIEYFEMTDTV